MVHTHTYITKCNKISKRPTTDDLQVSLNFYHYHINKGAYDAVVFTPRPFGPKGYCRRLRSSVCPSVCP